MVRKCSSLPHRCFRTEYASQVSIVFWIFPLFHFSIEEPLPFLDFDLTSSTHDRPEGLLPLLCLPIQSFRQQLIVMLRLQQCHPRGS